MAEPPPHPLLAPAPPVKGMRRDIAEKLRLAMGGGLARDLVFTAPTGAIDRRRRVAIAEAGDGELVTIEAEVDAHLPPPSPKAPYRVRLRDESGFLSVVYFRAQGDMLKRMWPIGQKRLVAGKVDHYGGERQMLHPDHVADPERGEAPPLVEPVYPLIQGLPLRAAQRAIAACLPLIADIPEWLDASLIRQEGFPGFAEALLRIHRPEDPADILPEAPFRRRLAFDELFLRQCALQLRRAERRTGGGLAMAFDGALAHRIAASLPYALTRAQIRTGEEIAADLREPHPMLRLLQGDVGSGKTVVAALAIANAAEAGFQAALMAPTEILARQHGETLIPLLAAAGLEAVVLTGRDRGKERAALLERLAAGEIACAVGTHALFQDRVRFSRLGLVVIDEQHRFGVSDRARLVEKGASPHVLVMSATPIPRTLSLAVHGDMDLSLLDEKPPGRKPIRTVAMPISRIEALTTAIAEAGARGERAYWVCPLIAESEVSDFAAVEARFEELKARFGDRVSLVHGQMAAGAREAAMERFKRGESFILVATTVIEVGVNVPEATIMIIEDADRFGLAQLHQLRGRIGRGDKGGSCVLVWRPPLGHNARERLDALRRTDDGFQIAEIDFRQRGAGDLLGVRQSGMPAFRFVAAEAHAAMLGPADQAARVAIGRDPLLQSDQGRAIAVGLALFANSATEDSIRGG